MLQVYKVIIEETVTGAFEVRANSAEEAFHKAEKDYKEGRMVNEPGEVQKVRAAVVDALGTTRINFAEL